MHLLVENMKINFVENEEEEENEAPFSLTVGEEKKFIDSSIDSFIIDCFFLFTMPFQHKKASGE